MDTETLQEMDKQADKIIGRWSFAALGANVLPPPLDMVVVGAVFASMGRHIAKIYGVPMTRLLLRDLGVAIAKGISGVLAGYVGMGLLKWVPGVNIWVAVLVQPPLVGAVAYAAGHAFKQYYHAVITEGRPLTTAEVGELAKKVLDEKLGRLLRERGYGLQEGPTSKEPIEKRPYLERQVILLADKLPRKDYLRLTRNPSLLCCVSRVQIENVDFPAGHPRPETLYVGHPLRPTRYYLATEFHDRLFEDKVIEISRVLRCLGAKKTKIEHIEGRGFDEKITLDLEVLGTNNKATSGYNRKSERSITWETNYASTTRSELPQDMIWYDYEAWWKEICESRNTHRMQTFELDLKYNDDFGINERLENSIKNLKLKLNLEVAFTGFKKTHWHISGEFADA
jgi:uncharacterized protein (DUF697 family)